MKLDLGCGTNKRVGFVGIDRIALSGVDHIVDLRHSPWPWPTNSVTEVYSSHFVEHLEAAERVIFVNELYRVLEVGASATIITPDWCSAMAYGDLTHKWPPVSEFWFLYLNRKWRNDNAPHNDFYKCNFATSWQRLATDTVSARSARYQKIALSNYKDTAIAIVASLTKLDMDA